MINLNGTTEIGIFTFEETGCEVPIKILANINSNLSARMMISNNIDDFDEDDCVTVVIEDAPRIYGNLKLKDHHMEQVVDWMFLNWRQLLDIWQCGAELDIDDILDSLVKI